MKPKTLKVIYWVVTLLFALFMLFGAVSGLMGDENADKIMTDLGYPTYLNIILGVAKILGVIAILQMRFPTLNEWAYAGFTIDIIGATASFLLAKFPVGQSLFTLVFLGVMFVSYFLRNKVYKISH